MNPSCFHAIDCLYGIVCVVSDSKIADMNPGWVPVLVETLCCISLKETHLMFQEFIVSALIKCQKGLED
jgi:hypothetical protein